MPDRTEAPSFHDPTSPSSKRASDHLSLLVLLPGEEPRTHLLPVSGTLHLGRSGENDIPLPHPSCSRRHASLRIGPQPAIADLGSANGTCMRGKPLSPEQFVPLAEGEPVELGDAVIVLQRLPARPEVPVPSDASWHPPVVQDPAMKALYAMVERVAPSDLNVLILGETGAGKELVAESLHRASPRRGGPLVRLNCGAVSPHLVESELFGHERGAFTGAARTKPGLLETAHGGTVFLDEVGELPANVQVTLLRVIEERRVLRVGGLEPRTVDVRFVSATNRDLRAAIDEGRFRQDLYFRLDGITVEVPPLRERPGEIDALVARFVADAARRMRGGPAPTFEPEVYDAFRRHAWPGNVRELRNTVERAVVLAGAGPVTLEHLPRSMLEPSAGAGAGVQVTASTAAPTEAPTARPPAGSSPLKSELEELERQRILDALAQCAGNQTRAAKLLGISRRTLAKRLDAYGIPRPQKG